MIKNVPTDNPEFSLWWGYIDETYDPGILPELMGRALKKRWYTLLQYNDSRWLPELREAVSRFVWQQYSLPAWPEDIIITNWSTASIDLVTRAILGWKYDAVAFEPIYDTALEILKINSRQLETVDYYPKTGDFSWDVLEEKLARESVQLLYLNPHFHNPTWCTLSLNQKRKILDLCVKYNVQILEDDPYWLYDFSGKSGNELAQSSLRNLDHEGHTVTYVNSFSKIFFPWIRLGYMVGPRQTLDAVSHIQKYTTSSANLLMQWTIIEALEAWKIHHTIEHYKNALAMKYSQTQAALAREWLNDFFDFTEWNGGFFIWWQTKEWLQINTDDLLSVTQTHGTSFIPWSKYFTSPDNQHLRLSYGQIKSENLEEAVGRFGKSVKSYLQT